MNTSPDTIKILPIMFKGVIIPASVPNNDDKSGDTNIVMTISVENINDVFKGLTYLCA